MIPVPALLAKPAVKWIGLALAAVVIVVTVVLYLDGVREDGKKSGRSEVTNAVQTETIRKTDEARTDKEKASEAVRTAPIDSVIDGLR